MKSSDGISCSFQYRLVFILFSFILLTLFVPLVYGKDYSNSEITKVVVLGTGNPMPNPNRWGASVAVVVNGQPYFVDAGEGVWRAAGRATPLYGGDIEGLHWQNHKYIFLTHLHSDHTIGLPGLLLQPWSLGIYNRKVPAHVYGPPGTENLVKNLLVAYQGDIAERIYGSKKNDIGWRSIGHNIFKPGIIYEDENVKVEAFATAHTVYPLTFAYRFTTPDKVVVISGDTRPCEGIEKASEGADILVHEVFGLDHLTEIPAGVWQGHTSKIKAAVSRYHTSTKELAELAGRVKPGILVLYHEQNWSDDPNANVKEIRRFGYKGEVISANDGDIF